MGLLDDRYLELHRRFLHHRRFKAIRRCQILDYAVFEDLPDVSYPGPRMRVLTDASSGVNELLNSINHFSVAISDLDAWAKVLNEIDVEEDRFSALFEIITPVAFLTLSFPAAIRGKIVFVVARMIRDTFYLRAHNGEHIGDHELTERRLASVVQKMENGELRVLAERLSEAITEIDGENYRAATNNYRNRANHQITPNLEIGERFAFAPMSGEGIEGFSFGVERSLKLEQLLGPLVEQHESCRHVCHNFLEVLTAFRSHWRTTPGYN